MTPSLVNGNVLNAYSSLSGAPISIAFSADVAVGDLLLILVGAGYTGAGGSGDHPNSFTDDAGNTYTIDVDGFLVGGGSLVGSVFVARTIVTSAITSGQHLHVDGITGFTGTRYHFRGVEFSGIGGLDSAGTAVGDEHPEDTQDTLTAHVSPAAAGELLVGLAAYDSPITGAVDDAGWTSLYLLHSSGSSGSDNTTMASYQIAAASGDTTYTTLGGVIPHGSSPTDCASVAVAYTSTGPPPLLNPGTVAAGTPQTGIVRH